MRSFHRVYGAHRNRKLAQALPVSVLTDNGRVFRDVDGTEYEILPIPSSEWPEGISKQAQPQFGKTHRIGSGH